MSDEFLHQRIKYLVEHGGLWDDPVEDIRRTLKWTVRIVSIAALLATISIAIHLFR
jgi:hypothetical protein